MRGVLAIVFAAAAMAGLGAQATSNAMNAKEKANLQHVRNWWLECLEGRNLEATSKYQADSYIQHNINFPTGRAGFMKIFGERFKAAGGPVTPPPKNFANPPVVQFAKGDFVVLIWERQAKDPADASKTYKYNTYDMLRIENGKVAEHWDYALKAKGTPRGGAPDGIDYDKVKFNYSAQEKKNLDIAIVEFTIDESRKLAALLGGPMPDDRLQSIAREASGSPMFVGEVRMKISRLGVS